MEAWELSLDNISLNIEPVFFEKHQIIKNIKPAIIETIQNIKKDKKAAEELFAIKDILHAMDIPIDNRAIARFRYNDEELPAAKIVNSCFDTPYILISPIGIYLIISFPS